MACWLTSVAPRADSAKLVFAHEPRLLTITHRDGTTSRIDAFTSRALTVNLDIGESMLVTQGLHSSCQARVARVHGQLRITFVTGIGMPGMPLYTTVEVLAAGRDGRFHDVRSGPADTHPDRR